MSTECAGCGVSYNQGHYLRHIRDSADSRCRAIYDLIYNYGSEDTSDEDNHHHFLNEPEHAVDSAGDFFGDYEEEDFGGWDNWWQAGEVGDDPQGDSEGYNNENDEEQDEEQDEDGEDLPLPEALLLPDHPSSHGTRSPSADGAPTPLHNVQEYVNKFGGLAGAPLPGRRDHLMYHQYQHRTQGAPWGAFQSQIDWEFARWAKLRGPSSTAVSDLLNIDGVSLLLLSAEHVFTACFIYLPLAA